MYKVVSVFGTHKNHLTAVDEDVLNDMYSKGYALKQIVVDPRVPTIDMAKAVLGVFELMPQ